VAGPEEGIPRGVRGSARGEAAGGEEMGQEVSAGGEGAANPKGGGVGRGRWKP